MKEKNINACIQQAGSMFTLFFGRRSVRNLQEAMEVDTLCFVRFFKAMMEKGIYVPPSPHEAWFISSAHEDNYLDETCKVIVDFLDE